MAGRVEYVRLMICDAMEIPELRDAVLRGSQRNRARVAAYFQQQIDAGIVRADLDPEILAHAFDSLFSSYTLFQAVFSSDSAEGLSEAATRQAAGIFTRGTISREA